MSASLSRIDSANPKPEISAFTAFCIRYWTTVLLVGIALGLTMFIWTFVHSFASPLFQIAIMVVAWRYGLRPGFVATILSGIFIEYFFVAQLYQPSGDVDNIARLFVFALEGWAFCWLITSRTKATALINDSRDRLQALSLRQQTLREEERKRIALEKSKELSYEEIAGMMDCPIGTVRSRIFRAREAVALKLRPLLDIAPDRRW